MLPQKSTVPASMSHAAAARNVPAAAREPDERDRDDAETVEELKVNGRLEAAQRLLVGERQRMAADGAGDRRDEQRQTGGGQQPLTLSRHLRLYVTGIDRERWWAR